jgi:hypothetical protein
MNTVSDFNVSYLSWLCIDTKSTSPFPSPRQFLFQKTGKRQSGIGFALNTKREEHHMRTAVSDSKQIPVSRISLFRFSMVTLPKGKKKNELDLNGEGFSDNAVAFDLWQPTLVEENADPATDHVTDNDAELWRENMRKGVAAQKIILQFNDFLISTWKPHPPEDAASDKRSPDTSFRQTPENVHPCHIMAKTILALNRTEQNGTDY